MANHLTMGNELIGNHAYTIEGLVNDGKDVKLRNPWGVVHAQVPLTDIRKYFVLLDRLK